MSNTKTGYVRITVSEIVLINLEQNISRHGWARYIIQIQKEQKIPNQSCKCTTKFYKINIDNITNAILGCFHKYVNTPNLSWVLAMLCATIYYLSLNYKEQNVQNYRQIL